tara:strand:+ start:9398 stop:10624 length:1227 start_codon:yes stop_codon:yes gene_type:complete
MAKKKFDDIAKKALTRKIENRLNESRMKYEDGHSERMHPALAKQLREKNHSLGTHPIFPEGDEMNFEEKLMSDRFAEVLKTYKRHSGQENVDMSTIYRDQMSLLGDTINLEIEHKDELEAIAINLVREEFDVTEADVEIIANLTTELDTAGIREQPDDTVELDFDSHADIDIAKGEVYKRRFVNAMIQGSAKKVNHMFHLADEQLQDLNPHLPSHYSKLMANADYVYMVNDTIGQDKRMIGGTVKVEFPKVDGNRPKIIAEAMTLPVLIHEIVKGVMEILSAHGLPEDGRLAKYVLGKADFMAAEAWDMRLGPPIWEKVMDSIPAEEFHLKHHVYTELVGLPVEEFNDVMREIMLGSRSGKAKVAEIIDEVKDDLRNDEFDNAMEKLSDDDDFGPEDLDNLDSDDWFM